MNDDFNREEQCVWISTDRESIMCTARKGIIKQRIRGCAWILQADLFIENNWWSTTCLLIRSQFWKEWWKSWIWSKYSLWFYLFSGCCKKSQAVNPRSLFYNKICWLSRGKMLHVLLQPRLRSPRDTETMSATILTFRELLKCCISAIGSLTRRVWIAPIQA